MQLPFAVPGKARAPGLFSRSISRPNVVMKSSLNRRHTEKPRYASGRAKGAASASSRDVAAVNNEFHKHKLLYGKKKPEATQSLLRRRLQQLFFPELCCWSERNCLRYLAKQGLFGKPTGRLCWGCGSCMSKTKKKFELRCGNRSCPAHQPRNLSGTDIALGFFGCSMSGCRFRPLSFFPPLCRAHQLPSGLHAFL